MEQCRTMTAAELFDPTNGVDFSQFGLILVRGVPGSGKSTLAQKIKKAMETEQDSLWAAETFETDAWFEKNGGYNVAKLGAAHSATQHNVNRALLRGVTCIVANTFTREFELAPYLNMTRQFTCCHTLIIDVYTQFGNVHGVPAEHVEKMKRRFVPVDHLKFSDAFEFEGVKIYA